MAVTIKDIQAAAQCITSAIERTPLKLSHTLSDILGCKVYIKFENMQFTASFKERGALNKLLSLSPEERASGVIAMSAGNHAKAVAYHATRLGIDATIVMSRLTPNIKVEDTRKLGARVVLEGDTLDAAAKCAMQMARDNGLIFIHPYDDAWVIAGQGTLALEMLEDQPDLDMIVAPIGGGGLISGVALAARELKPDIEVIGVQCSNYPSVYQLLRDESLTAGGITIAEGIAVKYPGELTLDIIRREVDDVLLVTEDDIEEAVYLYLNIEKTVAEGAGAAGLAALKAFPDRFAGKKVGVVLSGANIDTRILASVLMRNLARTGRLVRLDVKIDDTPGMLSNVTAMVGKYGGNILEVSHQRTFAHVGVKEADLNMTIETRDAEHTQEILDRLIEAGYEAGCL